MVIEEIIEKYKKYESISQLVSQINKDDKILDELDVLVPYEFPVKEKLYILANNIDIEDLFCPLGKKRLFQNSNKGFRPFCGNADICECNKSSISEKKQNYDSEKKENIQKKREKTSLERYQVRIPSMADSIKLKQEETNLNKFGTKSPTQNPQVLQKSSSTCLENNGTLWPQQNKEILQKTIDAFILETGVRRPAQVHIGAENLEKLNDKEWLTEKLEQNTIGELCRELNVSPSSISRARHNLDIEFKENGRSNGERELENFIKSFYEKEIIICDRTLLNPKEIDIVIPEKYLAFEYNGTYFHSELNHTKYKKEHLIKTEQLAVLGYQLIHIFESDWIFKNEIVKSRIKNLFGMNTRIGARKCEIIDISSMEEREFLNKNHLQGYQPGKISLGLIYNDELLSLMSFSKPRFNKKFEWELLRFVNKIDYSAVGGASRLFSAFLEMQNPKSVISYADRKWNSGKLYESLGFDLIHYSKPNYWYFKGNSVHSRIKFQKHKLPKLLEIFDPELSEWDNMVLNGWNRIWDCGNAVYGYIE